jgi:NAD(P)H-dependent flavin oxidoreductase YrpB (nitropropane dioxygenase family)
VDFIASGAGLPLQLPGLVENKRVMLIPIISSAQAASIMIRAWKKRFNRAPDALVVEGPLAGGHLGFKRVDLTGTSTILLEEIVAEVLGVVRRHEAEGNPHIPVIAAGGIFDGKDMARFLRLGASGVQMATRFVATFECSVADEFKQLYLKSGASDAVIITSPVGMPGRAIRNAFVRKIEEGGKVPYECRYQCLRTCDPATAPYCIAKAMFNAAKGDVDNAIVFCGSNVGRVNRIVHVRELIDEIMGEAETELSRE